MNRKKIWRSMICLALAFVIGASGLFAGTLPVYGETEAADAEESGMEAEPGTESAGGQEAAAESGTEVSSEDAAETMTTGDTVPEPETPEAASGTETVEPEPPVVAAPQTVGRQATGNFANVIVFARFKDSQATNFMVNPWLQSGTETYQELARRVFLDSSYKESVPAYLDAISYGQFKLNCYLLQDNQTTIVPYTLSNNFDYYSKQGYNADAEIIEEILTKGNLSVPQGTVLDYNKDGCIDNLTIILDNTWKATTEGETTPSELLSYPGAHKSTYQGSKTLNGLLVRNYNVLGANTAFSSLGTGVICHEFLHSLGYPDLYLETSTGPVTPVGWWDIMAASRPLRFPLAYMRHKVSGWLPIDTVTKDTSGLTLSPATSPTGNRAFILKPPQSSAEFFVIEYRVKAPSTEYYDTRIPGTGLIVYRINTKVPELSNYGTDDFGVYVHRIPDGSQSSAPMEKNSVFGPGDTIGSSDFSKKEADGAIVYSDGTNSGLTISGIKKNADGTMSFDVAFADAESLGMWMAEESGVPESKNAEGMDVVQAENGTVYMVSQADAGYRVSSLAKGAKSWSAVGNLISGVGTEVHITLYGGQPVVSVLSFGAKEQRIYQWNGSTWKEVRISASLLSAPHFNSVSVVGTDFGLFAVVTHPENGSNQDGVSVCKYNPGKNAFEIYKRMLVPAAEYAAQTTAVGGKNCFYLSYRAAGASDELKTVKVDSGGSITRGASGFALGGGGGIAMAVSGAGDSAYILIQKAGNDAEAVLLKCSGAKVEALTSFIVGNDSGRSGASRSISALAVMLKDGVPYAAIASSEPNGVNARIEVYYQKAAGGWGKLGNSLGISTASYLYLYSVENTVKSILAYNGTSGSCVTEHKKHVLAEDGGAVEKPTDPAPTKPTQPTKPTEAPTKPTQPTKPTNPVTPTSPVKPTEPAKPTTPAVPNASVRYRTHVQSYGDQGWRQDGQMSGTSGQAKRLEGIYIELVNPPMEGKIQYRTHIQSYGWETDWKENGRMSGTSNQAKRLEAIQIRLTGKMAEYYDVYYRVHAQSYGWLGWAKNGAGAGTAGYAKRLEAIEIRLVRKGDAAPGSSIGSFRQAGADAGVNYRTHVQSFGWQAWKSNGDMSGTSGQAKRLEGIEIKTENLGLSGSIQYKTHIQSYGWETDWRQNGQMSGTSGQAKRLEAIQIRLTGELAQLYDVYYRVHAQSYGWLGWAKNGTSAGTAGYAKRLEGIEIRLVEKGGPAPGPTNGAYVAK